MDGQMMLNSVKFRNCPSTHTKKKVFHYEQLEYHSSWEWLMGVVEKIESIRIEGRDRNVSVFIYNGCCRINRGYVGCHDDYSFISMEMQGAGAKFGATYSACIEFVKWYKIHKLQNGENKNI